MITIPGSIADAIKLEGERAYPNECCGALLGTIDGAGARAIAEIFPIRNNREEGERYHRFVIEPDDFLASERASRKLGLDVIGFYHSHPDHPAIPSNYDRDHALPWYSYIIVAVASGVAGDLTSWLLEPDRSKFAQEK